MKTIMFYLRHFPQFAVAGIALIVLSLIQLLDSEPKPELGQLAAPIADIATPVAWGGLFVGIALLLSGWFQADRMRRGRSK
jgi:hypothetical protein